MSTLPERLLLIELEHNHSWMQDLFKHLLAWYAFFLTTNVALLGYLFKDQDGQRPGALPPLMLFLCVGGLLVILVAWRYFACAAGRSREIVAELNRLAEGHAEMRPVFPLAAVSWGLLFLALGMAALGIVWSLLLRG